MAVPFAKTMRSLKEERRWTSLLTLAVLFLLVGAWAAWLVKGRVSVYAVTTTSRVESKGSIYPIQALRPGRVAANHLVLGKQVKEGDVLLELESNIEKLQLIEQRTQGPTLQAELDTLNKTIETETEALNEENAAGAAALEEARARVKEAEAVAAFTSIDVDRKSKLHEEGLGSKLDLERALSERDRQRATVEALNLGIRRQEKELRVRAAERQSRIEALQRQLGQVSGQRTRWNTAVDRLASEVKLQRIVAPISGRIAEASNLRPGAVVAAGQAVGTIVPDGALRVVAQFEPAKAIGRVQPGKRARVRLDGFPWTQYGTLTATVTHVADEVRDGFVRVELEPELQPRVSLQHGLPGTTEVEIEQISPAALILRIAGQMLAPQQPVQAASAPAGNK